MPDNPLGEFLRARREAVRPAAAEVPDGPRRRTPGLRRGELAVLAGVSVEYLTRLERGRDRSPSGQVIASLAAALRLTEDEHVHLIRLAKTSHGPARTAAAAVTRADGPSGGGPYGGSAALRPSLRALLDRIDPAPAVIVDRCGVVLAASVGFRELAAPVGLLEAASVPEFVFTDPRARAAFPEWDEVADEWAARLRAAADLGDDAAAALAVALARAAPESFVPRHTAPPRVPRWTGVERWRHPDGREQHLAFEALEVPGTQENRLVVYVPAG